METDLSKRWKGVLTRRYDSMGIELVDEMVGNLEHVYAQYMSSGCADPQFEKELNSSKNDTHVQRLGEMLLFERLNHAGFVTTSEEKGPDFRAEKDGEVVWLELITPTSGEDERIPELFDSHIPLHPSWENDLELRKRLLLRIIHAIDTKKDTYKKYVADKIIGEHDSCVIVINDALLCPDLPFFGVSHGADFGEGGRSLIEHATLGIGRVIWMPNDSQTKYHQVQTFRKTVSTMNSKKLATDQNLKPVNIFKRVLPQSSIKNISGIMQITLREDYGFLMKLRKMVETTKPEIITTLYPGSIVSNENATNPLSFALQKHLMRIAYLPPMTPAEWAEVLSKDFRRMCGME